MKDYYKIFVELCSHLCYADDYGSKKKVRVHNRAMDKIVKLENELDTPEGAEILLKLLFHENDHVILSSAMLCLKLKLHENEVKERVKYVHQNSKDHTIRFDAKMMLQINNLN